MTHNKNSKLLAVFLVMAFAVSSLSAVSVSLGGTADHANNPVFRGVGIGGELRVSSDGNFQVFLSQSLGLHSNQASVFGPGGKWVPVKTIADNRRIYFAKTSAGISVNAAAGIFRFGLDAGAYFAERWYCLAGYKAYDWGRVCDFTAGVMANAMFETRVAEMSDTWIFVRVGGAFEAWTFSVLQERLDKKRADGPWVQKGMGGLAFTCSCGIRCQF